ncbi:MAG: restriction endonuclease [Phycisphaeraceae bacterium]
MALWLVRAGKHGQYEQRFLDESRIYLTWSRLKSDLSQCADRDAVRELLRQLFPDATTAKLSNHVGQIWGFAKRMQPGDWLVMPSKTKPAIHIGEITGPYKHAPNEADPYYHYRDVKWIEQDIPRSNFDQDLLYSFGAFMTICQITRNDAERRVRTMANNGWLSDLTYRSPGTVTTDDGEETDEEADTDLELVAQDQIAKLIQAKYKGHGLATLVDAILRAQGYTTHKSPEGPDKGVDILAGRGPMGFEQPRLCVQVKSGDGPLDRPTLDQLIGTMQNMQAQYGLLVSWGGFKTSVDRERATQFFRVRLWDQADLIEQLLRHYNELDEDIQADLPLKRIWTVSLPDEVGE